MSNMYFVIRIDGGLLALNLYPAIVVLSHLKGVYMIRTSWGGRGYFYEQNLMRGVCMDRP